MVLWKILNVLSDEEEIYKEYFSLYKDYQEEISDVIVMKALLKSKKVFFITSDNYLKLDSMNYGVSSSVIIKRLSAAEAFELYGGDTINEVIDYGVCNLTN